MDLAVALFFLTAFLAVGAALVIARRSKRPLRRSAADPGGDVGYGVYTGGAFYDSGTGAEPGGDFQAASFGGGESGGGGAGSSWDGGASDGGGSDGGGGDGGGGGD